MATIAYNVALDSAYAFSTISELRRFSVEYQIITAAFYGKVASGTPF